VGDVDEIITALSAKGARSYRMSTEGARKEAPKFMSEYKQSYIRIK